MVPAWPPNRTGRARRAKGARAEQGWGKGERDALPTFSDGVPEILWFYFIFQRWPFDVWPLRDAGAGWPSLREPPSLPIAHRPIIAGRRSDAGPPF
jgi:hypothetical protein